MEILAIASVLAGVLLLIVLVTDVIGTVLVPSSGAGFISKRLYTTLWSSWKFASKLISGDKKRQFLARGEAFLMVASIVLWISLLILGFGLVYLPFAYQLVLPSNDVSNIVAALYVSGYSATTLGVGDLYPSSGAIKMLLVVEAALGFSILTATLTYLISVGSAIQQASTASRDINQYLSLGRPESIHIDDAIKRTIKPQAQDETLQWLTQVNAELATVIRTSEQYPLSQYFHNPSNASAIPQSLEHLLDYITLWNTTIDKKASKNMRDSPTVAACFSAGKHLLNIMAEHFADERVTRTELDKESKKIFKNYYSLLGEANIPLVDKKQAELAFVKSRSEWDGSLYEVKKGMLYPS